MHALVQREMTPPSIPATPNCICTSFQQSFHRIHRYEGHEGKDWRMQGNEYVSRLWHQDALLQEAQGGLLHLKACRHEKTLVWTHMKPLTFTQGINEWNTFFFIMSSFTLPPLYFWVYYMISVRLREYQAALLTGACQCKGGGIRCLPDRRQTGRGKVK